MKAVPCVVEAGATPVIDITGFTTIERLIVEVSPYVSVAVSTAAYVVCAKVLSTVIAPVVELM